MGVGFIRDKLEIKFLILYVTSRLMEPVPLEGIQELTMIDDGIDYFAFSECLSDLVKTEHLSLSDDGLYAITSKGLKNSEICQSGLPYSVRLRADKELAFYNQELLRKSQVKGRYHRRENGTYTVELSLNDDVDNLMQLQLMVANEEIAKDLKRRFESDPERLYSKLLETLFG